MFKSYAPQVFSELDEFDISRKRLEEEKVKDKISSLGKVICRHNLHHQVGVSLLHKHFEMSYDERLVETFVGKTSYAIPVIRNESTSVIPYMWKVCKDSESGLFHWYPLEFFECSEDKLSDSVVCNEDFFAEMATTLSDLELTNVFGVSLLHRDIMKPGKGEMLLEMSNDRERKLNFSAVSVKELSPKLEITQTLWTFKRGNRIDNSNSGICGFHCTGHGLGGSDDPTGDPGCSHCGHCGHGDPGSGCSHCGHSNDD